jgi:hypothetical protein
MKRALILGVLASLLAIPAASGAGGTLYAGDLDGQPGSEVLVKLKPGGEPIVSKFAAKEFTADCEGVTATLSKVRIRGNVHVGDRGGFRINDDNGKTTFKVRGQIHRHKADGTFHYFGTVEIDGASRDCDSGRLSWVAR